MVISIDKIYLFTLVSALLVFSCNTEDSPEAEALNSTAEKRVDLSKETTYTWDEAGCFLIEKLLTDECVKFTSKLGEENVDSVLLIFPEREVGNWCSVLQMKNFVVTVSYQDFKIKPKTHASEELFSVKSFFVTDLVKTQKYMSLDVVYPRSGSLYKVQGTREKGNIHFKKIVCAKY